MTIKFFFLDFISYFYQCGIALHQKLQQLYLIVSMNKLCLLFTILSFGVSQAVVKALPLCPKEISDDKLYSEHNLTPPPFKLFNIGLHNWTKEGM